MSHFVLGTAGHIDHGKTALVRALTGVDCDRLPEEKSRGITIDLGFAHIQLGPHRLALVDVPGHERFVRNMLAGATGLDLALLVIAADDSIMPQTREHFEILKILSLSGGAIALTKCDLVDSDWLDLVEADIREWTQGTFLENAAIIRTSAISGQGIEELRQELSRLCDATPIRQDSGLFRMAIDRAFTVAGHGSVTTGTVASGTVGVGEEVAWLPSGKTLRAKGLHSHDRAVERVGRGMRAAINCAGAKHDEFARGHQLAAPGYLEASKLVSVEIRASGDAPRGFRHRERYRLHIGTDDVLCALSLFGANELELGETAIGQLYLARPIAAVHGQPFVIRRISPVATLGGGRVLQPVARKIRRRDKNAIERLARLTDPDPRVRLESALAFAGLRSWTERDVCRDTGIPIQDIPPALEALSREGGLIELPVGPRRTARIPALAVADLEERTLRAVKRLHEARPRQSMVVRSHLATALADLGSDALVHALVDRLRQKNQVQADARRVALTGYSPKLSQAERRLKEDLFKAIRDGGVAPPGLAELLATAGPRANVVPELLQLLIEEERVAAITGELFLDFETEARIRRVVAERLAEKGEAGLSMSELRDALGATRKYSVPIGEYLDRVGVTIRDGDVRRLGPNAPDS